MRHTAYRLKYRFGRYLPLDTPVDVSLELSSLCNHKCSYCYHASPETLPFTRANMKLDVAKQIIKQAAINEVNSLKINYRGESTINPNFNAITAYAKKFRKGSTFLELILNSNFKFSTKNDQIFDGLCNLTKVKVSYDSFNKEVFEKQRAGGNHDTTTNNIEKFYNYHRRKNTELVIQAVRTKLNKDEDIEGEIKRRWPHASFSIRDMVEGRVDKDLDEYTDKKRNIDQRKPCLQAFVRLIFSHDGTAQVCCPDIESKLSLGNIKETSMYQMFNSFEAQQIRKSLRNGDAFKKHPCSTCPSFESHKGYSHPWGS